MKPVDVLVVGAGAIGGVVSAGLPPGGRRVVLTRTEAQAARLRDGGWTVDGVALGPVDAVGSLDGQAPFDVVLLTVPPDAVEAATAAMAPWLRPDGRVVVLQNGLCEERVAAVVGAERVVGAIVMFGASVEPSGDVRRTSAGGFTLGRLDGRSDGLEAIAALLAPIGPVQLTADLRGARWTKLVFNAAVSTLGTVGGAAVGPLLRDLGVRRAALALMAEGVAVAAAEGVTLQPLAGGLDLAWLVRRDVGWLGRALRHAVMLAVGLRYRSLRSSMLRALEAGKRPPVDWLNGEIVASGRRNGVPTPANEAAVAAVHRLADGDGRPGWEAVRALVGALRAVGG